MDASHVEGTADQRMLSDRRIEDDHDFREQRRFIDRREEKTPEMIPTAWPFPAGIDK